MSFDFLGSLYSVLTYVNPMTAILEWISNTFDFGDMSSMVDAIKTKLSTWLKGFGGFVGKAISSIFNLDESTDIKQAKPVEIKQEREVKIDPTTSQQTAGIFAKAQEKNQKAQNIEPREINTVEQNKPAMTRNRQEEQTERQIALLEQISNSMTDSVDIGKRSVREIRRSGAFT